MTPLYLDHTATTPLDPRVLDTMRPFLERTFGNPSSAHSFGRDAKQALEQARAAIARVIGAKPAEIFFTSGGTESDNFAIRGAARAAARAGRTRVVTSAAEHHAVLDTCESLKEESFDVVVLPVDVFGEVRREELLTAVNEKTALVSIILANNEVGTITRLAPIVEAARRNGALTHTDAVQALGKLPLSVDSPAVDLMTLSAHKTYGPKGVGVLYIRQGTAIDPILRGGGQERGRRPGTENVALAVGFARAAELAEEERAVESSRLAGLRDSLEKALRERFPGALVNGNPAARLPHLLSVSFDSRVRKMAGEMLVAAMDLEGVAVSSGSACTSGSIQPSHVLAAMGRDPETAKATLRFSFGRSNTGADVETALAALERVLSRMS